MKKHDSENKNVTYHGTVFQPVHLVIFHKKIYKSLLL